MNRKLRIVLSAVNATCGAVAVVCAFDAGSVTYAFAYMVWAVLSFASAANLIETDDEKEQAA
jgi:hypothetical protein